MKQGAVKLTDIKLNNRIKWFICLILFEIILLSFCWAYLDERIPHYATHVGNKNEEQVIHDLTDEYIVEQVFVSPREFDFITLDFSDHDLTIAGKTEIFIYNSDWEQIRYKIINNSDINYGESVQISYQDIGGGKAEEKYYVKIVESDTEAVALGLYGYKIEEGEEAAYVNGEKQSYAVSIGTHSYTNAFQVLTVLILFICALGTAITIFMCTSTRKAITEEKCFLMISIPFGICMLLFLSGNSVYDAQAHLAKTYQYSNKILGEGGRDSDNYTFMRSSDLKVGMEISGGVTNEQAQEFWRVLHDWRWLNRRDGMEQSVYHGASTGGTILGYLPNVLGMTVGRILNLGTYPMLYLSKIIGFAIYLSICYWAIKKSPILKTTIAFTAALPMSLYNATGITYDTMTVAATLLMCAYIFIWWERSLYKFEWIILGITVAFVAGCKGGIFLPLILLMLAVPLYRLHINKKRIILFSILVCITISFFLIKYGAVLNNALQVTITSDNPESRYGSGYCFIYPVSFIKMFLRSIVIRGDAYIGQLLGDRTVWTRNHIEWIIMIPFLIMILASGVRKENEILLMDIRKRVVVGFLLCAEFIGMHIILMSDTKVGSDFIYGVQGRYFIALVPLFVLFIREQHIIRKVSQVHKVYILYSMLQSIYMLSLLDKYF